MIKYRTRFNEIEAFEIVRETENQVILMLDNGRENRSNKVTDLTNWFDTWEEAHAFLVDQAQRDVDSLRMRLTQANGRLGQIKGMKP